MIVVINNCKCTKNKDYKFNLNNLIDYLNLRKKEKKIEDFCVVKTHNQFNKCIKNNNVTALILTGSPTFINQDSFKDFSINLYAINHFKNKIPILGICYGSQIINILNGGTINHMDKSISGYYNVNIIENINLLNLKKNQKLSCAFNFYDQLKTIPKNYKITASFTYNNKKYICGFANEKEKIYGLLFHPETNKKTHKILDNFLML
tara:strand:- start:334 stop:951 length:618 start_codon:yes stop_codon:yes gene_type:complete